MGMLIGGRVLNQGGAYCKEGAYHKEQILVTHKRKPCKHTEIEMTGEEKKIFSSTDSAVVEA